MGDVYESTDNDYFENLEQNQSKAARITNREPEDKSLKKINRLTKYEDLPITSTIALPDSSIAKWTETHEDTLNRAEHNFDRELAAHAEESPRIEKLYREAMEDKENLKEQLSAARISLRTQAKWLESSTFNEAKAAKLEKDIEKQEEEFKQLQHVRQQAHERVLQAAEFEAENQRKALKETQQAARETLLHTVEQGEQRTKEALKEQHAAATSEHHRILSDKQQEAQNAIKSQEAQKNAALGALKQTHEASATVRKQLIEQGEHDLRKQFDAAKAEHERILKQEREKHWQELHSVQQQVAAAAPPPPPNPTHTQAAAYDDAALREEIGRLRHELGGLKNASEIQQLKHDLNAYATTYKHS